MLLYESCRIATRKLNTLIKVSCWQTAELVGQAGPNSSVGPTPRTRPKLCDLYPGQATRGERFLLRQRVCGGLDKSNG